MNPNYRLVLMSKLLRNVRVSNCDYFIIISLTTHICKQPINTYMRAPGVDRYPGKFERYGVIFFSFIE